MTLTTKQVEAARPKDQAYKLADSAGLYLYISKAGGRSWRSNFVADRRQGTKTYGTYPELSLAQARAAHGIFRSEGTSKRSLTFEEVAKKWLKLKLPTLSNGKHQIQVSETLERFAYPMIGSMPVNTIKRADLVRVVRAVEEKGIIETAHRVAGRLKAVLDHAQDEGLLEQHPGAGLSRVITGRPRVKPMASIPVAEAPALLRIIGTYNEPVTKLGLLMLAHTFVRVGELRGMRWDEIKSDDAVWVVPEGRMKLKMPHVVPLSAAVIALLEDLRKLSGRSELVFESPIRPGHSISENTFLFALYRLGYRGRMTAHGFRALASTVLNEQSGFDKDVIERQLAHQETDEVRAAYNRAEYLPKRREMMDWWSQWLQKAAATE